VMALIGQRPATAIVRDALRPRLKTRRMARKREHKSEVGA